MPVYVDYFKKARSKWFKEAEWIAGKGRYALLAHCKVLTVTLHETIEQAEKDKKDIDKFGCGGTCYKKHEIIDLDTI